MPKIELIPVVEILYDEVPPFPSLGCHFYQASLLGESDWKYLVANHIGDTDIRESCALFGGFVLFMNSCPKLFPQCCGTLADIVNWQQICSLESFKMGKPVFLTEGHPSPEIHKEGTNVIFKCEGENEGFHPSTEVEFSVPYQVLCAAIQEAGLVLENIEKQLNSIAVDFGATSMRHLIYEIS